MCVFFNNNTFGGSAGSAERCAVLRAFLNIIITGNTQSRHHAGGVREQLLRIENNNSERVCVCEIVGRRRR